MGRFIRWCWTVKRKEGIESRSMIRLRIHEVLVYAFNHDLNELLKIDDRRR